MENSMQVVIPTLGRSKPHLQHTLRNLQGIKPTLVVQTHEADLYDAFGCPVYVLPKHITRVAETRDHVVHDMEGDDHVLFMDDDLQFAVRRNDDRTKFRQATQADIQEMLAAIDEQLHHTPMVGIGAREGGNRIVDERVYNTRIMRVLAFRRSYLKKYNICFTPLAVMEDFHVNLQILRSGADTCVLNNWVSNQAGGSNAPGGCSLYRTDALQAAAANELAARHKGFVKVVQKTTKTAWGGRTRTDVIVQWKRARESANALR